MRKISELDDGGDIRADDDVPVERGGDTFRVRRMLIPTNNLSDVASASSARSNLGLGSAAVQTDTRYVHRSNNLSDLSNAGTARSNLGLGTAAVEADSKYAHRTNNLSDLGSASTARSNLGLGTAAVQADTRYAHRGNNLSDLDSASSARTNLGLGSAATSDTGTGSSEVPTNANIDGRGFAQQVDSVSALRSGSYPSSLDRVWLSQYYADTPRVGGGELQADREDTTTADNGFTVIVDADGIRWKRPPLNRYDIRKAGAKADGATDDRDAVATTISQALTDGRPVYWPKDPVYMGSEIHVTDSGLTIIFDNSTVKVDSGFADDQVFRVRGVDIDNFVSDVSLFGTVHFEKASGSAVDVSFLDANWLQKFYIQNFYVEGPGAGNSSQGALSFRDTRQGRIDFIHGKNYGTTAAVAFLLRCREVTFGYSYGEGGSEVIDLGSSRGIDTGVVIGRDLDNEVLDAGQVISCRFPYTAGLGNIPSIINLKMEPFSSSGLMDGESAGVMDNEIGFVYGKEFTELGITWGASGATVDSPFRRNTIKHAILHSTQPGSRGIRPQAGNTDGEDNTIEYAHVVTDERPLHFQGTNKLRNTKLLAGYYETTGSAANVGDVLRVQGDNATPGLYVGPAVKFKGRSDVDAQAVDVNKCNPMRWFGEIEGSGREGLSLDYTGTTGQIDVEISAKISDTGRRAIRCEFDVASGAQVADLRIHDCRIKDHTNEAIFISQGNSGEVHGVFLEHNKIYCDGTNDGILWPSSGNVDYSADRYNDIFNAANTRSNNPGTNGQLVNGLET